MAIDLAMLGETLIPLGATKLVNSLTCWSWAPLSQHWTSPCFCWSSYLGKK